METCSLRVLTQVAALFQKRCQLKGTLILCLHVSEQKGRGKRPNGMNCHKL